ncbi:MAG TPA: protein translocase subunit SecD, partial [Patescibacteria group bacterium]|nr:protein translocase subunit SecD [Patescibacteria group bacterium]
TGEEEKEVKASHLLICYQEAQNCNSGLSKDEAYQKIKDIKQEADPNNFSELAREHSTGPSASKGGDLGWIQKGDMVKPFEDTVFEQESGTISYIVETKFGYHLIYKQDEREVKEYQVDDILIKTPDSQNMTGEQKIQWKTTKLTGKYLESASVQWNRTGRPQVALQFNDEGAELFEQITERNIGNKVGIFLDGKPISTPNVNEKIPGGRAVITGDFSVQEAKDLVMRLNEGALPVPIELVSQKTVGPTLGQESINDSLNAGIIGLILIALFMIAIYRIPGVISVLSLGVYGILVLAIFKVLSITLTLAGLAGFILSIGMAVDANVLILERLKEEFRRDKEVGDALPEAFKRAWPSIRDGNISTLITCFILMEFTTSLVRGFAITLGIGVLVSLFAAMVVTRNFMNLAPAKWLNKKIIGIK